MSASTVFAPVIIPTLCRYDHFKKCIESLARCTWAESTDVFIGVDYPAKESHWEGYNKICAFLRDFQNQHPFKSLNVIKRDRNYGFGPKGNSSHLREYVLSQYEYFIFSEDDNIFAPAFLDYINKGLEKFKDDPSVLAICGYRHFYDLKFGDNTFYRQNVDFSAWGYGMWKDRFEATAKTLYPAYWRKKAINPRTWKRIISNGWNRVANFLHMIYSKPIIDDNSLSVYMGINNIMIINPHISLVRNTGWDNSGEHCDNYDDVIAQKHLNQQIDNAPHFDFIGSGTECMSENHKIHVTQSYGRISFTTFLSRIFSNFF